VGIKRASSYQGPGGSLHTGSDGIMCLNPHDCRWSELERWAPDRSWSKAKPQWHKDMQSQSRLGQQQLGLLWGLVLAGDSRLSEGFQRSSVVPRRDRMVRSALRRTPPIFNIQ
jgi:hypothetical protein